MTAKQQVRIPQTDVATPMGPEVTERAEQAQFFQDIGHVVVEAVKEAVKPAAAAPTAAEAFDAELAKMEKQLEALEARARITRSPAAAELVSHRDSLAVHVSGWKLAGYVAGYGAIFMALGLLYYIGKEAGRTVIKRYLGTF